MSMMAIRQRIPLRLLRPVFVAAAVLVTALAVIVLTRGEGRVAAIWPVNAIVVAALLRSPRGAWSGILAGALAGDLAANLLVGDPLGRGLILAVSNQVEILIVASIADRHGRIRRVRISSSVRLVYAALAGSTASALIAAVGFKLTGGAAAYQAVALWWTADVLGLLIFTPLLLALTSAWSRRSFRLPGWRSIIGLALLAVVTAAIFPQDSLPLLFLPVAGLALLAATSGFAVATASILMISVIALLATTSGLGQLSLVEAELPVQILVLQLFLLTLTGVSLGVGSLASERRALIARLTAARRKAQGRAAHTRRLIEQWRLAESMANVGYWTLDLVSGAIFWSPEVYRIHGVEPTSFRLTAETALSFYDGADRASIQQAFRQSRRSGRDWDMNAAITRRSDGETRLVRCIGRVDPEDDRGVRFFGVIADLTEERRAAAEVAKQQARYRLLADTARDVIATYRADGVFRYISPAVKEVLGYAPDELVGRSAYEIVLPEDRYRVASCFAAMLASGEPTAIEYRALTRSGDIRWLEAKPRVQRGPDGKVVEIHDCVRDVTDRREREVALALARQDAEQAMHAKTRFLATVSHELRSPLHGILGFADVLADTRLSASQTGHLQRIISAGRTLAALIDDLLDFSRVETGQMPIENRPLDLKVLVEEVAEVAQAASGGHVVFTVSYAAELARRIVGDPLRIRQILTNLISNAAKFSPAGSVRTDVALAPDGDLLIQVSDDGPGLPDGDPERLFDSFVQGDESVGRRHGGVGLGLAISRSLARLMGGDVTIANAPAGGVVATVRLPYSPSTEASSRSETGRRGNGKLSGRVLVVDDSSVNVELMNLGLRGQGLDVDTATSGRVALEMLEAGLHPDVVLMDLWMPEMDGFETTRAIRRMAGRNSRVPIIALSADALPERVMACLEAGMDGHVSKPVRVQELLPRINRLIGVGRDDPMNILCARYALRASVIADQLERLAASATTGGVHEIVSLAHQTAGTSGSLGFEAVAEAAQAVVAAGRGEGQEERSLASLVDTLVKAMRALSPALS